MTDAEESVYNFNHEKRGIALLIHNEEFDRDSGYKHRPGDTGDFERMKEIFRSLGFDVLPYRNLTAQQILNEAKKGKHELSRFMRGAEGVWSRRPDFIFFKSRHPELKIKIPNPDKII